MIKDHLSVTSPAPCHIRHEDFGPGSGCGRHGGERVPGKEESAQHHHLAQAGVNRQLGQNPSEGRQLILSIGTVQNVKKIAVEVLVG